MQKWLGLLTRALGHKRYLVGGLITAAVGFYGWASTNVSWLPAIPTWEIGAAVVMATVVWALIVRVRNLEQQLTPKLQLIGPIIDVRIDDETQHRMKLILVGIKNTCTRTITNTIGYIDVSTPKGEKIWPVELSLERQLGGVGPVNLRPDQEKRVTVAHLEESRPDTPIIIKHSGNGYKNAINRGEYIVTVVVYADDTKSSQIKFRIAVEDGELKTYEMENGTG